MKIAILSTLFISLHVFAQDDRPCWLIDPDDESTWFHPITSDLAKMKTYIEGVNLKDPVGDAKYKVSYGDYRLLGVADLGIEYPPLNKMKDDEILCTLGFRHPEGMSDAVENEEHAKLMEQWSEYAKKYNEVIIQMYNNGQIPLNKAI